MGFFGAIGGGLKKLGKGIVKVARSPVGAIAAGALGAPIGAIMLGKGIVDHVGGGRKKLSMGSLLGSAASGFAGGKAGGLLKGAAGSMGGWGSALQNPKDFGGAVVNQVTGGGGGAGGGGGSNPYSQGFVSDPYGATGAGGMVPPPAAGQGNFIGRAISDLSGGQKLALLGQGAGALSSAYGAHQAGAMQDKYFEREEEDRARRLARQEALNKMLTPMLGDYIQGMSRSA